MPSTLADGKVLLDAFPFDSNPNLITDVNGYLMGDRSVDAWTMRSAFKQFFSNGVFGTPANAWQIAKGAEGLTVTVQPGMAVIEGAMGGIEDRTGPLTVTLDNQAAAGNLCYGIFLRYDDNADVRGLTVYARKGAAGASPEIPKPDTTSANVYELRLGYVTVPNGSTDLTNATVTNEKGTSVCPYAAPFEEIDLDQIVSDAKNAANENLVKLLAEFDTYRDAINAALSDEEATYLQSQINAINEQLENFGINLESEVDDDTIEYASDNYPTIPEKLRVKNSGISSSQLSETVFTDSSDSTSGASSKIAATPSCVDAKITKFRQQVSEYVYLVPQAKDTKMRSYFNFSDQVIKESGGFTVGSDGLTVSIPICLAVQWHAKSTSNNLIVRINGEEVLTISVAEYTGETFLVWLDAGDKLQIYNNDNGTMYTSYVNIWGVI